MCADLNLDQVSTPAGTTRVLQKDRGFPIRRYGTEQGLGSEVGSSLVQDPAGRMWVGTEGGRCFFEGGWLSPFTGALPSQFVRSLLMDTDGALGVGHGRRHGPDQPRTVMDLSSSRRHPAGHDRR